MISSKQKVVSGHGTCKMHSLHVLETTGVLKKNE
jgi:hypothetical protein